MFRRGSNPFPRKKRDSWTDKKPQELYQLAMNFWTKDDYAQAVPAFQEAINKYQQQQQQQQEQQPGKEAVAWMDLFYCYHYMGHSLLQQGDHEEAIVVCMQGIAIAEDNAPHAFVLASTYHTLGVANLAMDQFSQAIQAFQKEIEIRCRQNNHSGRHSLSVASSYQSLGDTYRNKGEYNHAIQAYQKAMVIREMKAKDSLVLAETYGSMALTYCDIGDIQQAEDLVRQALSIVEAVDPSSNVLVGCVYLQVGIIWREKVNLTAARDMFDLAYPILQCHTNFESILVAHCLRETALTRMQMNDLSNDTWTKIEQAVQTLSKIAPTSVAMAVTKRAQGEWYRVNHLYDQAWICLNSAKDILYNKEVCSLEVTKTLESLALVSESTGDCRQALCYYKDAVTVYQKQGIRNQAAATTLRSIDRLETKIASESSDNLLRHGRHHSDLPFVVRVDSVHTATAFAPAPTNALNHNRARSASFNDFAASGRSIPSGVPMRVPSNGMTSIHASREGAVRTPQFLPEYKHQCQEVLASRDNGHDCARPNPNTNLQSPQDARADQRSMGNHATPLLESCSSRVDNVDDPLQHRASPNVTYDVVSGHEGLPVRNLDFVLGYKHQCQNAFAMEAQNRNDFAAPNCILNRNFHQTATTESKLGDADNCTDPLASHPSSSNLGINASSIDEKSGALNLFHEHSPHRNRSILRALEADDGKRHAVVRNFERNVNIGGDSTFQPDINNNCQIGEAVVETDNKNGGSVLNIDPDDVDNISLARMQHASNDRSQTQRNSLRVDAPRNSFQEGGMKSDRIATSTIFGVPSFVGHEPYRADNHNGDGNIAFAQRGTQADLTISELTFDSVVRLEPDDDVVPLVQEVVTVRLPEHNQDANKPILLYVDDEPLNNPRAIDILKKYFRVIQTSSTASAMYLLDELRTEPRVVVSDMGRREGSAGFSVYVAEAGLLLIDAIRSSGRNMPIIIFSTSDNVERYRDRVSQAGGDGIVGCNEDLHDLVLHVAANQVSHDNPQDSVIAEVTNFS